MTSLVERCSFSTVSGPFSASAFASGATLDPAAAASRSVSTMRALTSSSKSASSWFFSSSRRIRRDSMRFSPWEKTGLTSGVPSNVIIFSAVRYVT